MFIKDWKNELLTIPNMLSFFRLFLIPVYIVIYLNATQSRDYFLAGTILGVSCLTDMIDGQIARRFNMISTVGKVLDPLADKMTQLALTVCLSVRYPSLRAVLVLFLIKETFQTLTMIFMYRKGKVLTGAILPGKLCTTVLFISFIMLVLMPNLNIRIVNTIAFLDAGFLILAFIGYFLAYFGRNPKLQNVDD